MTDTATVFLIMNGEAAEDADLREMVQRLRERNYCIEPRVTWEGGDAGRYTEEACRAGADAIAACGGDGTLHEVVNAMMGFDKRPMLGGLPYGTGNDFLGGIGVEPRHGPEQFEQWLGLAPTPIDVGYDGERHFLNMATAGVGAEVTAEASRQLKEVAGSFAYFVRGIPAALDIPTRHAIIRAPELEWEGDLAFFFVGNGPRSGGGWRLCPAARINDGLLDVLIVPDMPLREMARHGREMVKAETPGDYGPMKYRQVEWVEVEFDEEVAINLDGEPAGGEEVRFSVVKEAVRFLVPPASDD